MASKKSFVKGALILTFAGVLAKVLGALYRIPFNRIVVEEGAALFDIICVIDSWDSFSCF